MPTQKCSLGERCSSDLQRHRRGRSMSSLVCEQADGRCRAGWVGSAHDNFAHKVELRVKGQRHVDAAVHERTEEGLRPRRRRPRGVGERSEYCVVDQTIVGAERPEIRRSVLVDLAASAAGRLLGDHVAGAVLDAHREHCTGCHRCGLATSERVGTAAEPQDRSRIARVRTVSRG